MAAERTTDREVVERIMAPSKYETHRIVRDLVAALITAREEGRREMAQYVNNFCARSPLCSRSFE